MAKKITKVNINSLTKNNLVSLKNVTVEFGIGVNKIKAVDDVTLNVPKGEILGLVGESGSGKTTIGNAIAGLISRKSGTIQVNKIKVPRKSSQIRGKIEKDMVENIQLIFQDPAESLNPYKPIWKIVKEGLDNVNIRDVFIKNYEKDTAMGLWRIVHTHAGEQPNFLKKASIDYLIDLLDLKEFDKVFNFLYVKCIKSFGKSKLPWSKIALTYLQMRLHKRDKILENKSNKQIKKQMVIDMLSKVGLSEDFLYGHALEFSGGQQQRVGISRALVLSPKLLIADEPISALDVSIQAQVINILKDLKEQLFLTIIFIAHDLRMVEYISDRIAIMYKGKIVEMGRTKDVVKNPLHPYSKMLLDAVPSIDGKKGSLLGFMYNPQGHNYQKEKPHWFQIGKKEHYLYGNSNEIQKWLQNDYKDFESLEEKKEFNHE